MRTSTIALTLVTVLFASTNSIVSATTAISQPTNLDSPPEVSLSLRVGTTDQKGDENEKERAGGTDIVMMAHKLSREEAKVVRQVAKQNDPSHILDKIGAPFTVINRQRVYSLHDPKYQLFLGELKRFRDNPRTYPNRS